MTKRVWIITTVATMIGIAANAQTQIGVGPSVYGYHIPAEFTIDGQSKIAVMGENGVVSIYNRNLQQTHQLMVSQLHQLDMTSIGHFGNGGDYGRVSITQTFFNNDSQYEYIIINGYEQDMWRGATIMSEDGTVIWSWQPSGNNWGGTSLVEWDGQYFIIAEENIGEEEYIFTWYRIDRSTQSITRVEGEMPINVFPSVVDRSQTITVELGESNNATEVQVVNANGQVVKTVAVQPGQRELKLRANDLGHGAHIVGTHSRDGQSACKIIVK